MKVKINGKDVEIPKNFNIIQLLEYLNIKTNFVAVELNKEIVKRSQWEETILKEKDSLEIVTFVGGG